MDSLNALMSAGVVLGLAVLLILACRWLVLWYWRLNEIAETLHEIAGLLRGRDSARPGFERDGWGPDGKV